MKLNVRAFTIAGGIFWGFSMLFMTLYVIWFSNGDSSMLQAFADFYKGYNISYSGAFIGLLWGVIDGGICGLLFSWLYNRFVA